MSISTPDLCDSYSDELSIAQPLFRHYGGRKAFGGPISTVRCQADNSKVGDQLRSAGAGRVLVVDGGGDMSCSLLGDMLAQAGADKGWQGVVVFGCVRDVEILATLPIGVLALAAFPRKTDKRGLGDIDVVVEFAGLSFTPGHYLYADQSGLVVAERELLS